MSVGGKLRRLFWSADRKRREFASAAANFGEAFPNAFVLIADPDTDVIIMQHKGIQVPVRYVHPVTKKRMNIVKNALMYRKVSKSIDQFLLAVDSGLYNIAKRLYDDRRRGVGRVLAAVGVGVEKQFEIDEKTGLVPSPLNLENAAEDRNESGE